MEGICLVLLCLTREARHIPVISSDLIPVNWYHPVGVFVIKSNRGWLKDRLMTQTALNLTSASVTIKPGETGCDYFSSGSVRVHVFKYM